MTAPLLHVESGGAGGLPLACLHGWGLNLRVFDALRAALAPSRTVVTIDLPGHGASGWDAARADFGAQAAQLLAQLPGRCVLLGWSLGGQLALELARRAPARFAGLVLVATTPRFVAAPDWPHGMAPDLMQRFAVQLARDWRATVAEFLQLQVRGSRDATATLDELQCALREHGAARPEALAAGLAILRDTDLRGQLAAVGVQTLVVGGQHDRITPPGATDYLATHLPRARLVQLPRAGHAPFLSQPSAFNAALVEFMAAAA